MVELQPNICQAFVEAMSKPCEKQSIKSGHIERARSSCLEIETTQLADACSKWAAPHLYAFLVIQRMSLEVVSPSVWFGLKIATCTPFKSNFFCLNRKKAIGFPSNMIRQPRSRLGCAFADWLCFLLAFILFFREQTQRMSGERVSRACSAFKSSA